VAKVDRLLPQDQWQVADCSRTRLCPDRSEKRYGIDGSQTKSPGYVVMKALVTTGYGDVENLTLAEMPEPKTGPNDIKVQGSCRQHQSARLETAVRLRTRDAVGAAFSGDSRARASGEVMEAGDNVTSLWPGDRVLGFALSTFAERVVAQRQPGPRYPRNLI
jgi:NADPH:quinone reductase-like Zn-dependent oxidoreductase